MSPEQRREAVVRAALPLVAEFGGAVTTQQIARAAGIGEATIFRVFADKDELLDACVAEALDPTTALTELRSIALDQPLAVRLVEAADALEAYLSRMGSVIGALRASGHRRRRPSLLAPLPDRRPADCGAPVAKRADAAYPTGTGAGAAAGAAPGAGAASGAGAAPGAGAVLGAGVASGATTPAVARAGSSASETESDRSGDGDRELLGRAESHVATREAVAELFEPDQDSLRLPPSTLADLFLRLIFSRGRLPTTGDCDLDIEDVVDLFLFGALKQP